MAVDFKRINEELEDIVKEFEEKLNNGNLAEAEQIVKDIMAEFDSHNDIELDPISSDYDNNFHEIYSKLKDTAVNNSASTKAIEDLIDKSLGTLLKVNNVRKELIEKDPKQEEYRIALEEGITEAEEEIRKAEDRKTKYEAMVENIFIDNSDPTNPIDYRGNGKDTIDYAKILDRIKDVQSGSVQYLDKDLKSVNLNEANLIKKFDTSIDVTTDEGKKKIKDFIKGVKSNLTKQNNKIAIQSNMIKTFNEHIDIIDKENNLINSDIDDREEFINNFDDNTKQKIEDEKKFRHEDARAKMYGDKESAKKYKEAWKRFEAHRKTINSDDVGKNVNLSNGEVLKYNYEIIEDYPEKEEDLKFMQLESWEERAKRCGMVAGITAKMQGEDLDKVQKEIEDTVYRPLFKTTLEKLENELNEMNNWAYGTTFTDDDRKKKEDEIKDLKSEMWKLHERDVDYVKNYNSSSFSTRETVALLRTGGSAMMSRNNNLKQRTAMDRIKTFFKWTSFAPKADGKRHIIRTAISNIGGITSLPIRLLETGIGNIVAAGVYVKSKADGTYNMPTPYKASWGARKEARQRYYRDRGSSAFGAWFKSWFKNGRDENGNKIDIDQKLLEDRCKQIDISIEDKYIRGARADRIAKIEEAKKNQEIRSAMYQDKARSSEVYQDLYDYLENGKKKFKGNVDVNKTIQSIMRDAVLESDPDFEKKNKKRPSLVVSDDKKDNKKLSANKKRDGKFVQDNPNMQEEDLNKNINDNYDYSKTIGDTIWTNAVSRRDLARAKTKKIDRGLKIAAAVTMAGIRYLTRPVTIYEPGQNPKGEHIQDIYIQKPKLKQTTFYTKGHKSVTENISYDNATVGDCGGGNVGDTAYFSSDLDPSMATAKFRSIDDTIQGVNFRFTDVNGNNVTYSIGDMNIKDFLDQNPQYGRFSTVYQDLNVDASTPISKLPDLLPPDIKREFEKALNASQDKLDFFNNSVELSKGQGISMGRGWFNADIDKTATKVVDKIVDIPHVKQEIAGWQNVKIDMSGFEAVINSLKKGTPGRWITKKSKLYDFGNGVMVVGIPSMVAQAINQGCFPAFLKKRINAANGHQIDNNDNLRMSDRDAYDMWIENDENGDFVTTNGFDTKDPGYDKEER